MKKVRNIVIALLALLVALVGCGAKNENEISNAGINNEVNTEIKDETNIDETETADYENQEASEVFDMDINFLKMENTEENKVYSSLSIKCALNMLKEGANDSMKQKIENAIGSNFKVPSYTNSENYSLANALFIRDSKKDEVNQNFINSVKTNSKAEIIFDEFKNANNVNNWIKEKTFNMLENVLNDGDVDNTDVALVNTLAIDMEWREGYYDEDQMKKGIFHKKDGSDKDVLYLKSGFSVSKFELPEDVLENIEEYDYTYMPYSHIYMTDEYYKETGEEFCYHDGYEYGLYQNEKINAFSKELKEYNGSVLEIVGIMPKEEDLQRYISQFKKEDLNQILKKLESNNAKDGYDTLINTAFPRFEFEYELNLKKLLNELGLSDIFDGTANSFEAIMKNFAIDEAKSKTVIDVNEQGIKAASATSFSGSGGGGIEVPSVFVNIVFDKPFMFFVLDKDTKEIQFSGTTYDPTDYETATKLHNSSNVV